MSRSSPWRQKCPPSVEKRQEKVLSDGGVPFFLVRQGGPTAFGIRDDARRLIYQVRLGDPHRCSCPVYYREKDLCVHICWVLLRKFRIMSHDPLSYQLGLLPREINGILQGVYDTRPQQIVPSEIPREGLLESMKVPQRDISDEDICPICQEELAKKKKVPVTFCRYGCGNNVHLTCMKLWVEHQPMEKGTPNVLCPLCRGVFSNRQDLMHEIRISRHCNPSASGGIIHHGFTCFHCDIKPVTGNLYRCYQCPLATFCSSCILLDVVQRSHQRHDFQFRQFPGQRWRLMPPGSFGSVLSPAVVEALQRREMGERDYELLMHLDESSRIISKKTLPERLLNQLPSVVVTSKHRLLDNGEQCSFCFRPFLVGEVARRLHCHHMFHATCIDFWLVHRSATCPLDGHDVNAKLVEGRAARPVRLDPSTEGVKERESHTDDKRKSLLATGLVLCGRHLDMVDNPNAGRHLKGHNESHFPNQTGQNCAGMTKYRRPALKARRYEYPEEDSRQGMTTPCNTPNSWYSPVGSPEPGECFRIRGKMSSPPPLPALPPPQPDRTSWTNRRTVKLRGAMILDDFSRNSAGHWRY